MTDPTTDLPERVHGIHHVSAIAGDPRATVDWYTDVLGLRLVKRTVNYDDQFMYHVYFGDRTGSPGTLFTLFPFGEHADPGRVGRPQAVATTFAVPDGSLGDWRDRLADHGVAVEREDRFGGSVLSFSDPDGQPLELVDGVERVASSTPWGDGPVPANQAIRGVDGVTLSTASVYRTARVLEVLGYDLQAQDGDRIRYRLPDAPGGVVDLLDRDLPFGREGPGVVHHVAFRTPDRETLAAWQTRLDDVGLDVTRIKDRTYFQSLYFSEPGGVLFELATDGPGLAVDESADALGDSFALPDWLEDDREMIESQLPSLDS